MLSVLSVPWVFCDALIYGWLYKYSPIVHIHTWLKKVRGEGSNSSKQNITSIFQCRRCSFYKLIVWWLVYSSPIDQPYLYFPHRVMFEFGIKHRASNLVPVSGSLTPHGLVASHFLSKTKSGSDVWREPTWVWNILSWDQCDVVVPLA